MLHLCNHRRDGKITQSSSGLPVLSPDLSGCSGANAGHRGIHPHRRIRNEGFPQRLFDDWELG